MALKPILDTIDTEDTFYPGHTRYYHLDELCRSLKDVGFDILHKANINYCPPAVYYKKKIFGALKNALIKTSPRCYSSHIEILAKK
jgi:hypothetical protein